MRNFFLISVFLFSFTTSAKEGTRLESLFVWKVSEKLELSAREQKELGAVLKRLGEEKRAALRQMKNSLEQMKKQKKPEDVQRNLSSYQSAVKAYGEIGSKEFIELQKVLSVEKLAQYFVLKQRWSENLRRSL